VQFGVLNLAVPFRLKNGTFVMRLKGLKSGTNAGLSITKGDVTLTTRHAVSPGNEWETGFSRTIDRGRYSATLTGVAVENNIRFLSGIGEIDLPGSPAYGRVVFFDPIGERLVSRGHGVIRTDVLDDGHFSTGERRGHDISLRYRSSNNREAGFDVELREAPIDRRVTAVWRAGVVEAGPLYVLGHGRKRSTEKGRHVLNLDSGPHCKCGLFFDVSRRNLVHRHLLLAGSALCASRSRAKRPDCWIRRLPSDG
jgi:hypothetical protein